MSSISNRIKEVREDNGLSITDLARLLEQNRQRVQDIELENQKVPQDFLVKFIEHFNIDANWLLTGKGEMYRDVPSQCEFDPQTLAIARMVKELDEPEKSSIKTFVCEKTELKQMKMQLSELSMRMSA